MSEEYLRCRYCDSAFMLKDVNAVKLDKQIDIKHDRYGWHCPACAIENRGFAFKQDEDDLETTQPQPTQSDNICDYCRLGRGHEDCEYQAGENADGEKVQWNNPINCFKGKGIINEHMA